MSEGAPSIVRAWLGRFVCWTFRTYRLSFQMCKLKIPSNPLDNLPLPSGTLVNS